MVGYIIKIENLPTFAGEKNWYAHRIQRGRFSLKHPLSNHIVLLKIDG